MKKISMILLIGVLVLTGGCSNVADSSAPISVSESAPSDSGEENSDNAQSRPSDIPGKNQNEVLGKIKTISASEITLEIGTMNRPERTQGEQGADNPRSENGKSRRERPNGGSRPDSAASMPDQQSDDSTLQEERPSGANRGGPGGGFPGGSMDLEYTGDTASYILPDSVTITKGMGKNSEKLTISDLAEGDIVQLLLDEKEQPVSIRVFGKAE